MTQRPLPEIPPPDSGPDAAHARSQSRSKIKKPRMFKVVLLNDDYTPMDFVVHILQHFFRLPYPQAKHLMLEVHSQGRAVCGVFSREMAETKVANVNAYACGKKHPLLCVMEPN